LFCFKNESIEKLIDSLSSSTKSIFDDEDALLTNPVPSALGADMMI